jgi:3-oxoacyl-[acyl-carrier protein] reductase
MLLDGKTAVITGAGRGIGRAIALAFAREGCDIAVAARSESEIEETRRLAAETGRRVVSVRCDVADLASVTAMAQAVLAELGRVDILVNNAGYGRFRPFVELTDEEFTRTIDVNLTGAFRCIKAFLPGMMAQKSGRIINVSSVSGLKAIDRQSAYCASKHGLNGLSKTLALELRPHGIAVHALCPGGVTTRLSEEEMPDRDKTDWMMPEDIAHVALFLASMGPRATTDVIHVRRFGGEPL